MRQTLVDESLIFYCSSTFMQKKLNQVILKTLGMRRWNVHGHVYLEYMRERLSSCGQDYLMRGRVWMHLVSKLKVDTMNAAHVYELMARLEEYQPCQTRLGLADNIRMHLERLSESAHDLRLYDVVDSRPFHSLQAFQTTATQVGTASRYQ